jgi:hypothetical protein
MRGSTSARRADQPSNPNIFVQIGLVVLVALACKNAILVVEFAQQLHLGGKSRAEAAVEAHRLRLRPITMTSFAFILNLSIQGCARGGSRFRVGGMSFDLLNCSAGFTGRFNAPGAAGSSLRDGLQVCLAHHEGFILRIEIAR